MRIIDQSFEILTETDPLKLIERAGRTCWQSMDKIGPDSAERFVQAITKAGHWSVLEHASMAFVVNSATYTWIKLKEYDTYLRFTFGHRPIVSGNFRAWLEFFQEVVDDSRNMDGLAVPNQVKCIAEY